ncbi:MAG: RpiB/LacA/LacB family sugar-phosphate isomerase [Treponema sp.]|jgi:ribose 5-phosphate isomerase B|nr:RpiB/LacA/LacB family sugar-phosphate isomerase [Treponema sp.]
MLSIAVGCDTNAEGMKNALVAFIKELGFANITDYGSASLYPELAFKLSTSVSEGKYDRGILLCGTGIGMCISANKVPGVYAAVLENPYSAERAQLSNMANIACFGAQTTGLETAKKLLKIWLDVTYTPNERSEPKLKLIRDYENVCPGETKAT